MDLSIVTTLYNSAVHLREFFARIKKTADSLSLDYEIIMVNDGSPDNSLSVALELHRMAENVVVIDLSRNFGHHKAIMTGLAHVRADKVFLIDCDLEEEPELLSRFYTAFTQEDAVDVIYGVQEKRKGQWGERVSGAIFYKLFNLLSRYPIPPNLTTVRLMSKRYVDNLIRHGESEIFLAGIWAITGFVQIPMLVKKESLSESSYSFKKKLSLFFNGITSFSSKPLVYIALFGFCIVNLSVIYTLYLVFSKFFYKSIYPGYTSTLASLWFLGGVIIFSIGVVGIYISKIFLEVKRRPFTIVRDIYRD